MLRNMKKALMPAIALAALFMAACEGPVMMDNDGFGGALNAARAISKSEEEITQPQLVWAPAASAGSISTQDMLALDFGKDDEDTPVFVAGGRVGEIDYSTDGENWTQANNNGGFGYAPGTYSSVINGIAYGEDEDGNPVFVAVGDSDDTVSDYGGVDYTKIAYSPNGGQDWKGLVANTPDLPISTSNFFRSVAFGKIKDGETSVPTFVAGCNSGGQMVYSTNGGKSWTISATGSAVFAAADCQAIAFGEDPSGNGVFVALGGNRAATPYSGYSYDGINWNRTDAPIFCKGATYANGLFIGSGQGGDVITSPTGLPGSWTSASSGITTFLNTVAYGYGKQYQYYVVGASRDIGYIGSPYPVPTPNPLGPYASSGGTIPNWIDQIAFGVPGDGIARFVAVGDAGTVLYCRIQ